MRRLSICLLVFITIGCSSLQIQKNDSIPKKITKGMARVPFCLLTCGYSELYYATDRKVKSWIGYKVNDLIMSWGPPSQVYDDEAGGKFIVYTERRTYVSPGYATTTSSGQAYGFVSGDSIIIDGYSQSQTTYYPPQMHQWSVFRMFRVNRYGRITAYSWKGL